ncbi:MAG: hypothetical protein KAW12_18305 [Candidatus Aminicenantes bacterium]|nr:hypothetical protein [Candidatus Aminicenantes bacterium]
MKILDKIFEKKLNPQLNDVKFKRSYSEEFKDYWELNKKYEGVGHINKEKVLFKSEIDAEEWIKNKENFEKLKWGTDGFEEKDSVPQHKFELIFNAGPKKEILKTLDNIKETISKDFVEKEDRMFLGKNYRLIIEDESYHIFGERAIESKERSEEEKKTYSKLSDLKSEYRDYVKFLGGDVSIVTGGLSILYLAAVNLVVNLFISSSGGFVMPASSPGTMTISSMLLIVVIPLFIISLKNFFLSRRIKKILGFV